MKKTIRKIISDWEIQHRFTNEDGINVKFFIDLCMKDLKKLLKGD